MKTQSIIKKQLALSCLAALGLLTTSVHAADSWIGIIGNGPSVNAGDNSDAGGRIDMTVGTTGLTPVTAMVRVAGQPAISVKGPIGGPLVSGSLVVPTMTVYYTTVGDRFTGGAACRVERAAIGTTPLKVIGHFQGWKKTPQVPLINGVKGLYNFVLPEASPGTGLGLGTTWGSFTLAAAGTYNMVGRTATNEAFTCSAFVGPNTPGQNLALFSVQPSKSTLCGLLLLDHAGGFPNYIKNSSVIWNRPFAYSGNTYTFGFHAALDVDGGRYTPTTMAFINWVQAHPPVGFLNPTANLTFTVMGSPLNTNIAANSPDRVIDAVQYAANQLTSGGGIATALPIGTTKTSMKLNYNTGKTIATGCKFILQDYSSVLYQNITRTVSYSGIGYPTNKPGTFGGAALDGFFMVPDMPFNLVAPPLMHSGNVKLR